LVKRRPVVKPSLCRERHEFPARLLGRPEFLKGLRSLGAAGSGGLFPGRPLGHVKRCQQRFTFTLRTAPIVPVVANRRAVCVLLPSPLKHRGYPGPDLDSARVVLGREDALIGGALARQALWNHLAGFVFVAVEANNPYLIERPEQGRAHDARNQAPQLSLRRTWPVSH